MSVPSSSDWFLLIFLDNFDLPIVLDCFFRWIRMQPVLLILRCMEVQRPSTLIPKLITCRVMRLLRVQILQSENQPVRRARSLEEEGSLLSEHEGYHGLLLTMRLPNSLNVSVSDFRNVVHSLIEHY